MINQNVGNKNLITGYFGKLPGFNDFIKYNATGSEVLILDNWLQEGIQHTKLKLGNNWKNYYNNSTRITFVYPFTNTENIILGVISPSNDKSGRSFPFLMFSIVRKNSETDQSYFILPCIFNELFHNLNEIIELNNMTEDSSNLKSVIDGMSFQNYYNADALKGYANFIQNTKVSEVFELSDENSFTLESFFENHIKIFDHFISISFQSNNNQATDTLVISFYIQLLKKVFKKINTVPGIFWLNNDNGGVLFLTFAKPVPKDFIDLFFSNQILQDNSTNNDLVKLINYHSGKSFVRDNALINTNINLNEFLNTIGNYIN